MEYRILGKTGYRISSISLGTWQVGGKWGDPFNHQNADKILKTAIDSGINFIDTADVYSDGESEKAVGRAVRAQNNKIYVATKCGRKLQPHTSEQYTVKTLREFVESSLRNMGLDTIDLIQLHCPPTEVYYRPEIFELFETLESEGKIQNLGVSVEKVEEAVKAIEFSNVTAVQIIFNMFRQRPSELFFKLAKEKNIGIIVRVPLASGLLTGTYNLNTSFTPGDHRNFNRSGKFFDKGETFSGVNYENGLNAVNEVKKLFPEGVNLAPYALKWILEFNEVSCIIPGASNPAQVLNNLDVFKVNSLTHAQRNGIDSIYNQYIKQQVHHLW